ncbi:hypothetical protein KUTeg_013293 [Tegillarca granosa]|uniref:Uncharacterized protein n=1 Tax=Tegillarca granosa TaxID=220873 RepID=A0ABQ9ET97_TEGGR|nr:hypothetical protein KUTeg_013293 [Tegillarca granosa]
MLDLATAENKRKLPDKEKLMPSIGNGYVATVVHSDTMYRSDLFNGYNITSHRARIPSTCAINVTSISRTIDSSEYWLDIGRGMYKEIYKGSLYQIELNMYAHRKYSSLLVTEMYVWNNARSENLTLTLNVNKGDESIDLDILQNKPLFSDKTVK